MPPSVDRLSTFQRERMRQRRIWVFDLDNTLYPARTNLFAHIDQRMGRFIADLLNVDLIEARRLQKLYFRDYGTTLKGLMERHKVDPDAFLDYVHDIDLDAIAPDRLLAGAIDRLPGRKLIYTNGSHGHAEAVLKRLGLDGAFDGIFDIAAADYVPKPEATSFSRFLDAHAVDGHQAVMFEDMARNLIPAAAAGMMTVWLDNGSELGDYGERAGTIDIVTGDLGRLLAAMVDA